MSLKNFWHRSHEASRRPPLVVNDYTHWLLVEYLEKPRIPPDFTGGVLSSIVNCTSNPKPACLAVEQLGHSDWYIVPKRCVSRVKATDCPRCQDLLAQSIGLDIVWEAQG